MVSRKHSLYNNYNTKWSEAVCSVIHTNTSAVFLGMTQYYSLHCKQRVGIEDVVHPNSFTVDSENDFLAE